MRRGGSLYALDEVAAKAAAAGGGGVPGLSDTEKQSNIANAKVYDDAIRRSMMTTADSHSARIKQMIKTRKETIKNAKVYDDAIMRTKRTEAAAHSSRIKQITAAKEEWQEFSSGMASSITDGIMQGKGLFESFGDFLKGWADKMISQVIEKHLIQPMIDSMSGMLGGGGMSGGFSLGGAGGGLGGFDFSSMFSGLWREWGSTS